MQTLSNQSNPLSEEFYLILSDEINESRIDFAADFSSFTLSLSSGSVMKQPVLPTTAAGNESISSTGTSSTSYTWAKGVKTKNNRITSGYFDANKTASKATDGNLCWAATASNMVGWWQKYYGVTSRIGTSVPTSASAIFTRFKQYWQNKGGKAYCAVAWWIAGDSTHFEYDDFYLSTIKKAYRNKATGGYYKSLYTGSDAYGLSYFKYIQGSSATEVANDFNTLLREGCAVGLTIGYDYNSRYGYFQSSHAITLWGITRNSNDRLTAIHVTDSDDRTTGVVTYSVSYNSKIGAYRINSGYLKNDYLIQYNVLEAFDRTGYSCPSSLKVSQSGQTVTFRWANRSSGSDVTHQLAYKLNGASKYTYVTTSNSSANVKLAADGKYVWCVRTMVGSSFTSDWKRSSFTFHGAPPVIKLSKPTPKKAAKNKSSVTFYWKVNERSTLALYVDNKRIYITKNALSVRRKYNFKDGNHSYTILAIDAHGNKSSKKGSFLCDTVAPGKTSGLTALSETGGATFSWNAAYDKNNVTYTLSYKKAGASSYTHITGIKGLSYTLNLTQGCTYTWAVRATDGNNNKGSYTFGANFTYEIPPTPSLESPYDLSVQEAEWEYADNGKYTVYTYLRWENGSDDDAVTYRLEYSFNGSTYMPLSSSNYTNTSTYVTLTGSTSSTFYWRVRAEDAYGTVSDWEYAPGFSLASDTKAPAKPTNTKVERRGQNSFKLSWTGIKDAATDYYEVKVFIGNSTSGSTYYTTTSSITFTLSSAEQRRWMVRSIDAWGNASAWVSGNGFENISTYKSGSSLSSTAAPDATDLGIALGSAQAPTELSMPEAPELGNKAEEVSATARLSPSVIDRELALSAGNFSACGTDSTWGTIGNELCSSLQETQEELIEKRHATLAAVV